MDKEILLESLGKENTNLIKTEINHSFKYIINNLREIKANGNTAMGPAVFLSLYLLYKAKIGSRIFLCTDGKSNRVIGDIFKDRKKTIEFYTKIGKIEKE